MGAGVDERALADLFASEYQRLLRLAYLFLRQRQSAEDVVQEAFVRVHRSQGWRDRSRAPAYLRQTVVNLARGRIRHAAVAARHAADAKPGMAEDAALAGERSDDRRQVLAAIDALPDRQRECVILRYYAELTGPEIADALGISAGAVKQHLHRALAALELTLEDVR